MVEQRARGLGAPQDLPGRNAAVLVIGLGRFGSSLALALDGIGREVLAVERDADLVATWSGRVPLIEADATNADALIQAGARDFPIAVVGIGNSVESSVLVAANLVDLGTKLIWAKAVSSEHGRILERIGVHHVVYPEHDAGARVAHLVSGRMMDFIELEHGFTIAKMHPPAAVLGRTIAELDAEKRYRVTVLGVKSPGGEFRYATPETRIGAEDVLILSGATEQLERFAHRS